MKISKLLLIVLLIIHSALASAQDIPSLFLAKQPEIKYKPNLKAAFLHLLLRTGKN